MTGAAPSDRIYYWLGPDGAIDPAAADGFWDDMAALDAAAEANPYLVTAHDLDGDFPHWEMHPEGEELLIAVSGRYRARLEHKDGAQEETELEAGQTLLIPRGTWHFLHTLAPGRIVFVTAGKGTQHRPA